MRENCLWWERKYLWDRNKKNVYGKKAWKHSTNERKYLWERQKDFHDNEERKHSIIRYKISRYEEKKNMIEMEEKIEDNLNIQE